MHRKCRELQDCPAKLKMPGPVAAFVQAACQIGCRFGEEDGQIEIVNRTCHWMKVSAKVIKNLLQHAWVRYVATRCITRKHFDLRAFDWKGNKKAVAGLTYYQKALVTIFQTGRHITNDFISKFLPSVEDKCVLCGAPDSREHRIFHCRKLDDIRPKQQLMRRIKSTWEETSWYFALVPSLPDSSQVFNRITNFNVPFNTPCNDQEVHAIFTDGTAFFSDVPELTLAASAAVEVCSHSCVLLTTVDGVVPGVEQSSFAAELFAVLLALNKWFHVAIYSDCQTVVDLVQDLIDRKPRRHDLRGCLMLWDRIVDHFSCHLERNISINKVKAHVRIHNSMSTADRWKAWANELADQCAKEVILTKNRIAFHQLERLHKKVMQQRQDAQEYFAFVAMTSDRCIRASAVKMKERQRDNVFNPDHPTLAIPLKTIKMNIQLSHDQHQSFPWGPVYLWRLTQWAQMLEWPEDQHQDAADISMLEMYIDYQLATCSIVPRNIFNKQQRDQYTAPCYILDDLHVQADSSPRTLGDQMMVWAKSLSWIHRMTPYKMFPCDPIPKAKSLATLGSSATAKGFKCRPKLVYSTEVISLLHAYFNTNVGHNRTLNRCIDIPRKTSILHQMPEGLDTSFEQRAKYIRHAGRFFPSGGE